MKTTSAQGYLQSFRPCRAFIVPLGRCQPVPDHGRESEDEVRTKRLINIFRQELSSSSPVLRPVGIVTYSAIGT